MSEEPATLAEAYDGWAAPQRQASDAGTDAGLAIPCERINALDLP